MYKFKYSFQIGGFEDVFNGIKTAASFGYDGVEVCGADKYFKMGKEIKRSAQNSGLAISSLCTWFFDCDLAHPDVKVREEGIEWMKTVLDFAADMETPTAIINPTKLGKHRPLAAEEDEYKWGAESIQKVSEIASKVNVRLALEAWNRYDTYFINNFEKAKKIVAMIDRDNVGYMLDTFHLNIEEVDMGATVRNAGKRLYNIHVGDSNRLAPGMGHTDFIPILQALKDNEYDGNVTMEVLPPAADGFYYAKHHDMNFICVDCCKKAIETLKSLELKLK